MKYTYSKGVGARAVVEALKFKGLSEVVSNAKWDNLSTPGADAVAVELKAEMLRVGWQTGWPYCAAFCEMVWRRAYQGRVEQDIVREMLNPSCISSWENAVSVGWTSQTPAIGAIGIMRKGSSYQGHAFIVVGSEGTTLQTIEANTSPATNDPNRDREGDGVYAKTRALKFKPTTGLHLIGFILPCIAQ